MTFLKVELLFVQKSTTKLSVHVYSSTVIVQQPFDLNYLREELLESFSLCMYKFL